MIKANIILDYPDWKKKIKNPSNYIIKKLKTLSKIPSFRNKKQEFTLLLTNNRKMKSLNNKFVSVLYLQLLTYKPNKWNLYHHTKKYYVLFPNTF